ncbi:hypothetical protein [Hyphococcus sp.]|uniref:hypothetical protein n=1 Tax=Hyphococcus sp. TaxID=2038636 RepID=UPI003CCB7D50
MNIQHTEKLPPWFWAIAALALLWNLAGVGAFIADAAMSEETVSTLPQAQQDMRGNTPAWLMIVYGIAVFTGLLGAIALLLRKQWAAPVFGVSLGAIIVQMGYVIFGLNAVRALGASAVMFPTFVVAIGVFLVWFALKSQRKGWLRA